MFKKSVEAKAQQRLSGADKKKLKRSVRDRFRHASDSDIDVLLPSKTEIAVAKYPNRVLVYSWEGGFPMFFDVDGRGSEIHPTVYALWKVPDLLPSFWLKGGEVSRFIIGGADLMFPGICIPAEGLPSFLAGEIWSVKVPGNPAPIAVGTTNMSSTEAIKAGLRGKALRISHHYRDSLWESAEGRHIPNAGFFEDVVVEDPSLVLSMSHEDDVLVDQENGEDGDDAGVNIDQSSSERIITDLSELKVTEESLTDESIVEEHQSMSVDDIDALLDKCLLQALHTTLKDKDLPIPGSTLWSNHILPCRPSGVTLDIKNSSHKKLTKWLQSKSSTGLISVKEDKHKKETVLTAVNRNHDDYKSFKPEKRQVEKKEQSSDNNATEAQKSNKLLEVAEIYKPSVHVNPIFAAVGSDNRGLYTASEATEIAFSYIEKQNLVKSTDKSIVVLDAILCDALFKGAIKKGTMYPTEIHKKDVSHAFINRMQAHHVVTRGNDSVVRKGALKTIQILTERRQGNKKVTRFSGLESFLIDPEALASELQKKFASSTTVAELPGKKGYEVLVQGGVIDDLAKHLVEQYGIPKKYIEVLDKTKR